jgi:hypothetical protein
MMLEPLNHYRSSVLVEGVSYEIRFEVMPDTTRFRIYRTRDRHTRREPLATGTIRPGMARYDEPATLPMALDRELHERYLDLCERLP